MALIIKDFEKQNILQPKEVAALVTRLPSAHLVGLTSILYKPINEFAALNIPISSSCKGAFYPDFRAIVIHDLESLEMASHILYHEIGHYVFHVIIGSYLKKEWVIISKKSNSFVSDYSRRSAIEDFSESYAKYLLDFDRLKSIPEKYMFMSDKVFNVL